MNYFADSHTETHTPALWNGIGLISCAFLSSCITNPFRMFMLQIGLQIRVALSSMIYHKVFRIEHITFNLLSMMRETVNQSSLL